MTPELAIAEDAVAHECAKAVLDGSDVHVAMGRAGRYRVLGLAVELTRHPSGVRHIPPPVVVTFDGEHWLRVMCLLQELRRAA